MIRLTFIIITCFVLSACTGSQHRSQNLDMENISSIPSSFDEKITFLFDKIYGKDFISLALNDKDFVSSILAIDDTTVPSSLKNCVFQNLDRADYKDTLNNQLTKFVSERGENFVLWQQEIEFLTEINAYLYHHPKQIDFDTDDIYQSSALTILDKNDATRLINNIRNPKIAPIMLILGLPLTAENSVEGEIADLSLAQVLIVDQYVRDAKQKCLTE